MKGQNKILRLLAASLALFLLCGCSRVRVPEEEMRPADNPVEGIPADPKPDSRPPEVPAQPDPEPVLLLEEGLCALLPGAEDTYVLYDCRGREVRRFPASDPGLAGVYSADSIVAGRRLSDGSPVLPEASEQARWVQDDAGFSVYDPQAGLVYRLDAAGQRQFSCPVPAGAECVSLLPLGRDFFFGAWSGSGTGKDPWVLHGPRVILDTTGKVKQDLSLWLTAPILGILGGDTLLVARPGDALADAYDREGCCLGQGLRLIEEVGVQRALGGVLCNAVWKDGWICSAGLQPQLICPDPQEVTLCGEYASGVSYDIAGVSSNGDLLLCGDDAAVWGVQKGILAVQWQGINYHFPAGKRKYQRLQCCSRELAVAYAWDEDGSGSLRLLSLDTGSVLEYDCPAGARAAAMLGDGYAVFATAQTDSVTGAEVFRYWVVDAGGNLRCESTTPLLPCADVPYLLCRDGARVTIADLDGYRLISGGAASLG